MATARERAERQILDSIETLATELPTAVDRPLGALLAALFSELGVVPDVVRDAARSAATARELPDVRQRFFALVSRFWDFLGESDALGAERARVIASHLARCADHPALLFFFERDATSRGLSAASRCFARELALRFPHFRRQRQRAVIDRTLLELLGAPAELLRFHSNGHLASFAVPVRDGPSLTLDARPGSGRFSQVGKRGGSGFVIDERFSAGRVHTTFNSPWHDGVESSEPGEWVCWVLQNVGTIVSHVAGSRCQSTDAPHAPRPRRARRLHRGA